MPTEPELYYFCDPRSPRTLIAAESGGVLHADVAAGGPACDVVAVPDFLADEPACRTVWELVDTQFRTRSKFLAVWRCASHVVTHRDEDGKLAGFLLVSSPVNWQIDYVVVRPDARGRGVAGALVRTAVARAKALNVPYIMLSSKASLRPLYEACGFEVVRTSAPAAVG